MPGTPSSLSTHFAGCICITIWCQLEREGKGQIGKGKNNGRCKVLFLVVVHPASGHSDEESRVSQLKPSILGSDK